MTTVFIVFSDSDLATKSRPSVVGVYTSSAAAEAHAASITDARYNQLGYFLSFPVADTFTESETPEDEDDSLASSQ